MLPRALVINGSDDGSADDDRLRPALRRCEVLGVDCARTPAVFAGDSYSVSQCGEPPRAWDNTEKYRSGVKLAHKRALEEIVRRDERTLVLEDDFGLPNLDAEQMRSMVSEFAAETVGDDIAYVGHYPCPRTEGTDAEHTGKCTGHAMLITPAAAAKILDPASAMPWCDSVPIDVVYHDWCTQQHLRCSFAPNAPRNYDAFQADGIIHQRTIPTVRSMF